MQPWSFKLLLLGAFVAFLFAGPSAGAVGDRLAHVQGRNGGPVYPFLTSLRDNIVELVFGRRPSKPDTATSSGPAQTRRYAKETVIRFNISTPTEEAALSAAADQLYLDIWAFTKNYVDVRLPKEDVSSLLTLLPRSLHQSFSTLVPDLAAAVWATYPSASSRSRARQLDRPFDRQSSFAIPQDDTDNVFFHDYQPLVVIKRWMSLLESLFPAIVRVVHVGQTSEGHNITGLRVGKVHHHHHGPGEREEPPPRKTILIAGGLHAREWISTSTVNYLAWSLVSAYGDESLITKLLDHFDWVFVPVMNPDGYEYTWKTDRLWRKTRQGTNQHYCRGLDLDHAFGYEWDKFKKPEPCSETYGGEAAFEAIEAKSLSDWARNQTEENNVKFVGFLDLHSYAQQVLFPYSYSCDKDPPNLENLEELAAGIAKAIRLSSGEPYSVISACEGVTSRDRRGTGPRIESGGGSAIDWFYHELKAKYSYQIKLRDTGSYGFLLPSQEIIPTGEEMFSALKYLGDFLLGNNGIEKPGVGTVAGSTLDNSSRVDELSELRRRRIKR